MRGRLAHGHRLGQLRKRPLEGFRGYQLQYTQHTHRAGHHFGARLRDGTGTALSPCSRHDARSNRDSGWPVGHVQLVNRRAGFVDFDQPLAGVVTRKDVAVRQASRSLDAQPMRSFAIPAPMDAPSSRPASLPRFLRGPSGSSWCFRSRAAAPGKAAGCQPRRAPGPHDLSRAIHLDNLSCRLYRDQHRARCGQAAMAHAIPRQIRVRILPNLPALRCHFDQACPGQYLRSGYCRSQDARR